MAGLSTGAPIVKVYHAKSMILPDVSRVLACLYEKDIRFETHTASSYKSLLRLQASNHAPVPFYDGLTFLEESREICRYIAETYEHHGYPYLLGKDSLERASIEQWLHHEEHNFNPPSRSLFCHLAFPLDEEGDDIDLQKRKLEEVLEVYEQRLSDSEFLAGNKFTLADLVHLPNSHYITESDKFVYLYDSRKNVQRWWHAISTRDSWQKVLKDIKKVEQQHKDEELKKQQQQQWQRGHPTTTRHQIRLDSRKHTGTKSQTILVPPPAGIISPSPTAPQTEEPRPTETFPDEASVSSRPAVPHDAQGNTEEETVESSSSGAKLLDSRLAAAFPPKQSLDEDGYGSIPPLQTGHTDDRHNRQQDRDTAAPRQMMAQDAFEEKKIADPALFKAQTFDYQQAQADTPPQMQPPAEDPQATIPFRRRYSGDEDATKQSKHAASRPKRMAVQEVQANFEETKAHDSWSSREQLSDARRAPGPLPRHEVHDARNTTVPFQKRYLDTVGNTKEVEDVTYMPRRMAGEDAQESFEETKFSDSTSSRAQPLDYQRTDAPSRKQEAIEDPPGVTSPSEKIYAHVEDPNKHSRDTAFKPNEMSGQDARDPSEEAEARNSTLFRVQPQDAPGQRQSPDAWRAPAIPSKQAAAEDDLSVSQSSPTRYPRAEETSKQTRAAASRSVHIAAQDAKDAQAKVSDSRSSIGQPSDARAAAPLTNTNAPLQTRYPDTKGTTKEAKDTFDETKIPDSASSQVQPLDSQRTSRKKEATEDSPRATSPFKKGHSDAEKRSPNDEDIIKRPRGTTSAPRRTTAQDANGTFQDSKPADSVPSGEQPLSAWQPVVTPPRQEIKDSHSTSSTFRKTYPYVEDSTSQAGDTAFVPRRIRTEDTTEETTVADSASSSAKPTYIPRTALPLSEQAEAEEDAWDKGRESQSTSSKAEPTDPRSPIKVERTPSVYQDPRIAQDSHEQAQTIPTGASSDGPAPKHQQATVVPSTSEEISTPSAPPRANVRDDHSSEAPFRRDIVDDQNEALPLLGKEPTSQVQQATELLQEAAPDGDTSIKSSTIDQWRRASVPLQDAKDAQAKVSDSRSSIGQPSDARAAAPITKQEVPDARGTNAPFETRYLDTKGTTKEAEDTFEETKIPDAASSQVQPLDSQRADSTSRKKEATEDSPRAASPFKKGHSDAEKRSANDEDIIKRPRGTASAPRRTTAQDANGTFQDSKPAGSVPSREQPLSTWKPVVTTTRQEIEDSHSTISAFRKTYPDVEDSTSQDGDTAFAPRRIRTEDTTEETKVADSASSSEKPTYIPRTALPLSEQAEAEKDAWDKGKESSSTSSKAQPTDPRSPIKVERTPSVYQEDPRIAQDSHELAQTIPTGMTSAGPAPKHQQAPVVRDDHRSEEPFKRDTVRDDHRSEEPFTRDTVNDRKELLPLLGKEPTSQVQRANELLQEAAPDGDTSSKSSTIDQWRRASVPLQDAKDAQAKVSDSRSSIGQPSDAQAAASLTKQEVPDARGTNAPFQTRYPDTKGTKQAQTIPTGVRSDGPAPKHQEAPVVPSTSEEISTPSAVPRANVRDDHNSEEPFKRDTVDDRKEALPLLGKDPTSHFQRATELLQEAAPDGDTSSKSSTIDQWRRASVPLQDITPKSGDDMLGVSTIDQQPIPMSQQAIPSTRGANEMIKRSVEQRFEPPAPTGAQTSDVQHAPPSLPGVATVGRAGELVQTQAPTLDARPTSAATPTKRATPDSHGTGDQEFVNTFDGQRSKTSKASHDSAIIHDDLSDASLSTHGATVHDKTTTSHTSEAQGSGTWPDSTPTPVNLRRPASDDELARRYLRDQGAQPPESTQEQTPLEGPRDSVSTEDVPSDALARTKFAKPTSTEGMSPTAGPASTLEAQLAEQKFAPSDKKSARAAEPLPSVESGKEYTGISAADQTKTPQTIFRQQPRPPAPITRQIPTSDTRHYTRKIQDVTLDNLPTDDSTIPLVPSYQQVPHAPKTVPDKNDMTPAPGTRDSPASDTKPASAKVQEVIPDNYRTDELKMPFVSSEKQGSYAGPSTEQHEGPSPDARSAVVHKETTKSPSRQAPVLEARPDSTPTDSYVRPTSGDEPGILPDQGAESPTAAQATYSEDLRNSISTQDIPANALGNFKKPGSRSTTQKAISSTPLQASDLVAQPDSAKGEEVSPATKKFAPSDQDSVHSAQQPSLAKPGKEDATVDAAERTLPTVISQQETHGMRVAPPSDTQSSKIQEVDHDIDLGKSVPSQEKVSRAGRTSESREGLTSHVHSSVVHDKATTVPASLTSISDAALDSTSTSSDVHPASGIQPGIEPPSGKQAPQFLKDLDSVPAEDIPADASGEAQSLRPSESPDDQLGRPGEVALAEDKPSSSDQDSPHSVDKPPLSDSTKEQSTVAAPDQAKASQTIFGQQDIAPSLTRMTDPSSDSQHASRKLPKVPPVDRRIHGSSPGQEQVPRVGRVSEQREGPTPDTHGAIVEESMTHTTGPTSAPDAQHDASGKVQPLKATGEVTPADQNIAPSGNYPLFEPLSAVESRKEDSSVAEAEQSEVPEPIIGQQDIGYAPGISEPVRDDDGNKESVSRKEQVSHDQHASEPHEGSHPDVHGSFIDKKTTAPSSQAQSSDANRDSPPIHGDADPRSGGQSTTRILPDHGAQQAGTTKSPPPLEALQYSESTRHVPAGALGKAKPLKSTSVDQEVTSPTALPNTQLDTAPGEVATDAQNYALPGQDIARPAQLPFSAEPTKEEAVVAASDQTSGAQTIIGQQGITPDKDKEKNPLSESYTDHASRKSQDDDGIDESVPSQEQVSLGEHASEPREGTTTDSHGANVDDKINASSPVTSSLRSPQAQVPPRTQALPVDALGGPAFVQNVPADSLEKVESPRPPLTDQDVMAPMTGPAQAPDAPQGTTPGEATPAEQKFTPLDQDSTNSTRLSPPVESRKQLSDVATADRTNVSRSSAPDTVPSEAVLKELTKSAKSFLPMTGADPVQPPDEASFDLSSDEKTTMIKGDQANNISNVSLSANQAVGQSEGSAVKRALSEELVASFSQENPEGTSTEEKSKQQQQTDTRSSKDDSTKANGIISPNVLTTSGDIQPSPPKESMEATEESGNQQHADQAVFQSTLDNEKQVEETEAQDTGRDNREEMNLDANTDQKNSRTSRGETLEQSGEHVPAVQPRSKKTDSGSKSTKDAASGIQTDNISENSLRTSEESKQQVQTEGRTQGSEANAPGSKTEQPKETDLPGSNKSITSPSQAEASDRSEEQTSSSIQSGDNNSSKLDGSTNDTKSDDMEDNPSS